MTDVLWLVLAVAAVLLVLSLLTGRKGRPPPSRSSATPAARGPANLDALPLPKRTVQAKPLLSAWEQAVIGDLRRQMPPMHHLCPQVRLLDMLSVRDDDGSRRQITRNRLGSKSVDFAVIDPDGRVVLVIELNDRSHDRPERQQRDRLVHDALDQAGIPLAVFRPRQPTDLAPWLQQRPR